MKALPEEVFMAPDKEEALVEDNVNKGDMTSVSSYMAHSISFNLIY